uniref:Uncharacterized protein n=1 Tax=Tetraselmis sp. GSL018 TaxID=582737 RepID=A0A061SM87_9CHLO
MQVGDQWLQPNSCGSKALVADGSAMSAYPVMAQPIHPPVNSEIAQDGPTGAEVEHQQDQHRCVRESQSLSHLKMIILNDIATNRSQSRSVITGEYFYDKLGEEKGGWSLKEMFQLLRTGDEGTFESIRSFLEVCKGEENKDEVLCMLFPKCLSFFTSNEEVMRLARRDLNNAIYTYISKGQQLSKLTMLAAFGSRDYQLRKKVLSYAQEEQVGNLIDTMLLRHICALDDANPQHTYTALELNILKNVRRRVMEFPKEEKQQMYLADDNNHRTSPLFQ